MKKDLKEIELGEKQLENINGGGGFVNCPICGAYCANLTIHVRGQHPSYCPKCLAHFATVQEVAQHLRSCRG